jgi:hypothetical protein
MTSTPQSVLCWQDVMIIQAPHFNPFQAKGIHSGCRLCRLVKCHPEAIAWQQVVTKPFIPITQAPHLKSI